VLVGASVHTQALCLLRTVDLYFSVYLNNFFFFSLSNIVGKLLFPFKFTGVLSWTFMVQDFTPGGFIAPEIQYVSGQRSASSPVFLYCIIVWS